MDSQDRDKRLRRVEERLARMGALEDGFWIIVTAEEAQLRIPSIVTGDSAGS